MTKISKKSIIGNTGKTLEDVFPKVLWANSNYNSFNAQSITLNDAIENYSYYEIIAKNYTSNTYISTGKIPTNRLTRIINVSDGVPNFRDITALSGVNMTFGDCKFYTAYNDSNTRVYNYGCIPTEILAYK